MSKTEQENEVKFAVQDLAAVARRLEDAGALLEAPRVHEINLRFDTPGRSLTAEHRVLRLRQDAAAVMTYKGPADYGAGIASRQEIEFQVGDFSAARRLLEALGYEVAMMYEKYRTTYSLDDLTIVLDEMPFGSFVEIEGPHAGAIEAAAQRFHLRWDARCTASYLMLFERAKVALALDAQNLSFAEFEGVRVSVADMGLSYADM